MATSLLKSPFFLATMGHLFGTFGSQYFTEFFLSLPPWDIVFLNYYLQWVFEIWGERERKSNKRQQCARIEESIQADSVETFSVCACERFARTGRHIYKSVKDGYILMVDFGFCCCFSIVAFGVAMYQGTKKSGNCVHRGLYMVLK